MHDGALLIIGVGGIGCRWAKVAHSEIIDSADCLLVDSDSSSFRDYSNASSIHIGPEEVNQGIMPELSSSWASNMLMFY